MTDIILASFFVFSSIYGAPTVALTDGISTRPTVAPLIQMEGEANISANLPTRKEIEQKAKTFFKNDPILVEIARCESHFRQYDANGNVLKGTVNKGDLGLMQINKYYHEEKADDLGLNLTTVEGNMAYAQYLYNKEGVRPWMASSPCWGEEFNKTNKVQIALR